MFWADGGARGRKYRVRAAQTRDTRSRGFVALINRIATCSAVHTAWRAVIDRRWHGSGGENWTDGNWRLASSCLHPHGSSDFVSFLVSRTGLTGCGGYERDTFSSRSECSWFLSPFFLSFFFLIRLVERFQIRFLYIYVHSLELSFIISNSTNF